MDKYVIHIDGYPSFPEFRCEYSIYHGLEGGQGVGETKEYDLWFKESLVGYKCCLPLVPFFDLNIVVSLSYIELGE